LKPISRLLAHDITNLLGKHELVELSDDGLIVLVFKNYYASDSLVIYDTKERQQILILGDTETKERQHTKIPHYICEPYITDIHCSFLYNGNFILLYKTSFGLYKNGWMLVTKRGDNGTFYFLWNMETATFKFEIFGKHEGLEMENCKINKYKNVLAIWNNGLEAFSTQTGIMISNNKENYQDENNKNWHINFVCLDERFGERLLVTNFEDQSKIVAHLLDPYSLKLDNPVDIHFLDDEFNAKIIRVYSDKIIRVVTNQVQIHEIFQSELVERLRNDLKDQSNIHSQSIIEDILEKINNVDNNHNLDDEVIELIGHQNSWKYYKYSDQLLMFRNNDISQPVLKSNLKKTDFIDLKICAFILLSNDDLIVICDHYHNYNYYQNLSFVVTAKDGKLQMRYFFSNDNLKLDKKNDASENILETIFSDKYFSCIFNFDRYRFFALLKEAITHRKNEIVDMVFKQYIKLIKDDTSFFLLHSQAFLKAAITYNKSEVVDIIFKQCMKLIKDDPANINILKIISSLLPELYENYPAYISRFLSQTSLLLSPNQFNEPMYETSYLFPHTAELHIFEHTPISKTYFFLHYY
ncbi:28732_t:CDS:2, partial [Dentiscutata erythropus]